MIIRTIAMALKVVVTPVPYTNHMPTFTVAICRSANDVGRIIPVRMRSLSSFEYVKSRVVVFPVAIVIVIDTVVTGVVIMSNAVVCKVG